MPTGQGNFRKVPLKIWQGGVDLWDGGMRIFLVSLSLRMVKWHDNTGYKFLGILIIHFIYSSYMV